MKKILKISFVAGLLALFTNCETSELDLLLSPNNITVESADPNFVLNNVQLSFRNVVSGYSATSSQLVRLVNLFGTYNDAVDELTLTGEWGGSYGLFNDIDVLDGINDIAASPEDEIPYHLGVAQVIEAYTYMLLVDYLGEVPFSQANQPEEFPNPSVDDGAVIYQAQLELLDEAIANLSAESGPIPNDIFFGSFDPENWIALANTLKIRAYNNTRLIDPSGSAAGINAVLSQNFINTIEEDFQFNYGSTVNPIDSRSPLFVGNYLGGGAGTYMSNNLYDYMNVGDADEPFVETGTIDPRARYYFYRQTSNAPSGSFLPCLNNLSQYDYCYVGNLYWGRDHADDEGIPADNTRRTTYGVYPAGGAFDRNQFEQARVVSESMNGEGILPIFLSSFTHFILAESALTLGTGGGSPAALLEQGIRLSMEKVIGFNTLSTTTDDVNYAATQAEVDAYVARVISEFNAAAGEDAKLEIIEREYWIASFGNGIEPYNNYRRTGFPELQEPIIPAGPFPRSFRYPQTEVTVNPNIQQQQLTDRVFWDNNPAGFID
jgi:hypothetical protein